MNTPEHLSYEDTEDYTEVESKYRIKTFSFDYDQEVIDKLIERVKISREYIKTLI